MAAYPLYGTMRLESGARRGPPPAGSIWIGKDLASRLDLNVGERVKFGEKAFLIDGVIAEEPDRLGEGFTLGPVAIIGIADLPATQLIQPGSLFESKYRVRLPDSANPEAVGEALTAEFPGAGWDITDRSNGAPGTRRFIERMGQFLSLVGLAALVIAGIGVGNGVASYLAGKRPGLATLKVLGADSATVLRIYGLQILAVAAVSIFAGLVVGALAPFAIGAIAGDVLPVRPGFALYPLPLAVSAAYGLLIAIAFAMPPLAATKHIPAAGLYRATVDKAARIDRPALVAVAVALIAIIALAVGTAREPLFALGFIGAAIGLLLILVGLGWLVRRIASRLPRPRRPLLRLALANLHRPGASTGALVVALGLGLTLFVTLAAIQTSITNEIARTVPQRAPSFFVLDVPRDGAAQFRDLVTKAAPDAQINMIPALRGSVTEFRGQRVDELAELPEGAWVLRGDRGLTYSAVPPSGSELVGGQWWAADYKGPPLVSVEQEVATSLGLKIGDTLSVNVLGVEVQAKVASFRTVQWDNFGLNYVLVFSPGTFDAAPHNMVATVAVDPQGRNRAGAQHPARLPLGIADRGARCRVAGDDLADPDEPGDRRRGKHRDPGRHRGADRRDRRQPRAARVRQRDPETARRDAAPDIGRAGDGICGAGGGARGAGARARPDRGALCRGQPVRLHLRPRSAGRRRDVDRRGGIVVPDRYRGQLAVVVGETGAGAAEPVADLRSSVRVERSRAHELTGRQFRIRTTAATAATPSTTATIACQTCGATRPKWRPPT